MTFDEYWSGRHLPTEGQYRPLYDAALRAWNVALEQGFQDGFAEAKETDLVERGFADRLGKLERVREAARVIPLCNDCMEKSDDLLAALAAVGE